MALKIENGAKEHSFWDFKGQADYVDSWFLMDKPYLPLFIVSAYLLFVLKLGPAYMKSRPAMKLQNILIAYNGFQVLMSLFLLKLGTQNIMRHGVFQTTCLFRHEAIRKEILSGCYWFVIAKLTELLDTVFFVLRKKHSQVTFLHVYHHTFTAVMSWLLVKYGKTDDLVFVGTVNSFVHVWMYLYYGLSAFPGLAKYLWWKKYLTTMQLVQFVLVLIQISINSITSKCPPSILMMCMCGFNGFLFIYLFSDFYKNAYLKEEDERKPKIRKKDLNYASSNFLRKDKSKRKR